jgi:hypothetical protein
MLSLNGESFYRACAALSAIEASIRVSEQINKQADDDMSSHSRRMCLEQITDFREHLSVLQAGLTDDAAARIEGALRNSKAPFTYNELRFGIDNLQSRLRDELRHINLFVMSTPDHTFYEPKEPLFGFEVEGKFISASFDIAEAGKCMALKRPTAAVFHLMRILEIAIRAMSRCLGIDEPTKPAGRNWGITLKQIKENIDDRWPNAAQRSAGDGSMFESLYASLDAVRNPWRNSTMHVEQKYTDDEADHIFRVVRALLKRLACRMDENGDPKVAPQNEAD